MSDWKEAPAATQAGAVCEAAAARLLAIDEQAKLLSDERAELVKSIKSHINTNIVGAHDAGKYVIDVEHKHRFVWDSKRLEDALIAKTLPDFVKRKLSIDRKTWEALDAATQDEYADALTVQTTVAISVKEKA